MAMVALVPNFATPRLLKCAFGLTFCVITNSLTQAQTINFSINSGYTRYRYEEPGLMQLSGQQYVVGGRMLVKFETGYELAAEGRYAGAEVDYVSPQSGSSRGQRLSVHEFRLLGGRTYQLHNLEFHPFIGIGMRRLNNDAQGITTTNGDIGYLRVNTSKYLPLGVSFGVGNSIGVNVEYDHLLNGRQDSYVLDELIQNQQVRGHGHRVSITMPRNNWVAETYFQRWDIEASNVVVCLGGFQLCREPKNFATEIGINVKYLF